LIEVMAKAYGDVFADNVPLTEGVAALIAEALPKPGDKPKGGSGKSEKGLGSDYMKWLGKLPSDRLCYILAKFDPARAAELYLGTDYRVVQDMGEVYLEMQWNKIQSSFEASMYGFGGGYEGSKGGGDREVITYDLTTPAGKKEAMASLRASGFVQ